jgi:A/G-specific adenine glycosylase
MMLQQTQTARVVEKYVRFVDTLPDVRSLADAPTHEVLALWQGLGYNRRALYLKRAAAVIVRDFGGVIPKDEKSLLSLPGVGPATAGAVRAFTYGEPAVFIETNIRAVFIHHFFEERDAVDDREILPLVEATLDRNTPRTWYWGLMDYGVHLKESEGNPAARSAHHTTQSPFRGSDREIRGVVLALLVEKETVTKEDILARFPGENDRIGRIVADLEREGFLNVNGDSITAKGE